MGKTTGQTQIGHRHSAGAPHTRGAHPRHEGTAWNHVPTKSFPTRRSVEEAIGREVRDGIA